MDSKCLKSKIILFFFVLAFYANCGTALTYQEEQQQAAQQQNHSDSKSILAALGLAAGGGFGGGWAGFSATSLTFQSGGNGSFYSINVPSWPAPGTHGTIDVQLAQSGSSTLSISPSSFNIADDMSYPVTLSFVVTSGKPGSAQIIHTVSNVSTSPQTSAVNVGDVIGVVNVTVTP